MRKIFCVIMALLLCLMSFAGCGAEGAQPEEEGDGGLTIVTTIFPEYDWVMNILGDNPAGIEVILLTDSGVDIHSFQPNAQDIVDITSCDILVHVGGESDTFIEDALRNSVNDDMQVVSLMEVMGDKAKEEETLPGMEGEEHGDEDETEYDEHVWLSLGNAAYLCSAITNVICEADPENRETYENNLKDYTDKLNMLDKQYVMTVKGAETDTLLFGDRFPFRYMADDYGLNCFAAFSGCSTETEASFETVTFLAGKVDELGLTSVLTIENSDGRIAQAIIDNTEKKDQQILSLNSMQSVDMSEEGISYLGIMNDNLEVLRTALQKGE